MTKQDMITEQVSKINTEFLEEKFIALWGKAKTEQEKKELDIVTAEFSKRVSEVQLLKAMKSAKAA